MRSLQMTSVTDTMKEIINMKEMTTASEMGKKSWKSKVRKMGEKEAREALLKNLEKAREKRWIKPELTNAIDKETE